MDIEVRQLVPASVDASGDLPATQGTASELTEPAGESRKSQPAEGRKGNAPGLKLVAAASHSAPAAVVASPAPNKQNFYLSVNAKFTIAVLGAFLWMGASIYLALPWFEALSQLLGPVLAPLVIFGIAILPGFMNAFLVISLLLDRRPMHPPLDQYPEVTILIAAYNESASIVDTIKSIALQEYPGALHVIVINDGSKDNTAALVQVQMKKYPWLELIDLAKNGGKAKALNYGLAVVKSKLVLTVDADSYLYRSALKNIVERYMHDPANTRAVSGTVLVRNSRKNWITRTQEWDYFHGIAAIKRVQSLYQGTLVAQGAFSLYDRDTLIEVGGWPDCVGEDIVLTWAILKAGYRIGHSEHACLFTNAPDTLRQFVKQRQRWSRGMVEGFKQHPGILRKPRLSTFFVYWNLAFPLLDLIFTFFFIPGLILALFGHYFIVGPMTLALLPIAMVMNLFMFVVGKKTFTEKHLKVRQNFGGFLIYTLAYSLIMQPACLIGYLSEILNLKKTWGTK